MILMNYKGTAVHPFPCPVCISKSTRPNQDGKPTTLYAVVCGENADFIIASYHELVPAKMEIRRLVDVYGETPDALFTFMKDPYEEEKA